MGAVGVLKAPALGVEEFKQLAELTYNLCGVVLTDDKRSLLASRLAGVMRQRGLTSFTEYCQQLRSDRSGQLVSELVNSVSTNHTFFNRESVHFRFYENTALPEALHRQRTRGSKKLRVWCAACSTGQEPYMLAMLAMRQLGASYGTWDAGVLATDINDEVLEVTRQGIYPESQVQRLPLQYRSYFTRLSGNRFQATPQLRRELTVRRFNLVRPAYPFRDPFDVVFMRNVMIYFDEPTRSAIAKRLHAGLHPGGHVFVGRAESFPAGHPFDQLSAGIYRKV